MTEREYFMYLVADEAPRFERVLKAIPETNRDYKPDPKSKTAVELAQSMAMEAGTLKTILATGDLDFALTPKPDSQDMGVLAELFQTGLMTAKDAAADMSDEAWDTQARMHMAGEHEWKAPRGKMTMSMLLDLIHHRGQLSTYLRPMGGTVPSIYGPSADTRG